MMEDEMNNSKKTLKSLEVKFDWEIENIKN